jgi:hypothetical protein
VPNAAMIFIRNIIIFGFEEGKIEESKRCKIIENTALN